MSAYSPPRSGISIMVPRCYRMTMAVQMRKSARGGTSDAWHSLGARRIKKVTAVVLERVMCRNDALILNSSV